MVFWKDEFSLFAYLGDLSKFTLEQLKEKVFDDYQILLEKKNDIIIATFTEHSTNLVIHYTPDGIFKKIYSETWIKLNQIFLRSNTNG